MTESQPLNNGDPPGPPEFQNDGCIKNPQFLSTMEGIFKLIELVSVTFILLFIWQLCLFVMAFTM